MEMLKLPWIGDWLIVLHCSTQEQISGLNSYCSQFIAQKKLQGSFVFHAFYGVISVRDKQFIIACCDRTR